MKQTKQENKSPLETGGIFLTKRQKMTHKIIRFLALIGALYTPTTKAAEIQEPKPGLTLLATSEQNGDKNHSEITLKPDIKWELGEYKLGYYGSFYRSKDSDGTEMDWATFASEIRAENDDWALDIGRTSTREYAGYLYTPTTTSFDNQGMLKGSVRTYTGTILTHKESGFMLGQVAQDTRMTPSHWDNTLLGWKKELNEEWALQLQMTTGRQLLSSAGLTVKWKPTEKTTVVAEGFYWNKETTGILTANHKVTDELTLFAGAQLTAPEKGEATGLTTIGINYNLVKGIQLVAAAQYKFGADRETTALLGIKYTGNFR